MRPNQKAKIATLLVTVFLLLAAAGIWFYFQTARERGQAPNPGSEQVGNAENTSGAEISDAPSEPGELEGEAVADHLVLIRGGSFMMGSPDTERQRGMDEVQHEVQIGDFYADPYEVTQEDYQRIMGDNPSHFSGGRLPVENVTWFDAIGYCNKLSENCGLTPVYAINGQTVSWNHAANGYRLLTEAEWEYAARAGTTTIFNAGDQITSDDANFEGSYPYLIEENYVTRRDPSVVTSSYRGGTIEVDSLSPNQFGLYNMYGNVSEWCFDYYGAYDLAQAADPAGAVSGSLRVNRGGSYIDFAKHLRSAYRSATNPTDPDQNLGFRIARNARAGEGIVETTFSLDIQMPENPRILVAYFSYSGNTENAARIIRQKTGADLDSVYTR